MCSLEKNGTWIVVPKPKNVKIIGRKWVYTKKEGIPGVEPSWFKSRLVAKGYSQREGIYYNEILAAVACLYKSLITDHDCRRLRVRAVGC